MRGIAVNKERIEEIERRFYDYAVKGRGGPQFTMDDFRTIRELTDFAFKALTSKPTEVERTPRHPSDKWKLWANADPEQMEPYYSYWVGALTSEGLHAKADIATVLALLHQQRDDLDDDARRLHREKMDALFGSDGMPANAHLIEALDWALRRIRTSLDQGEMYAKAEAALEQAKLAKPVSPLETQSPEKP